MSNLICQYFNGIASSLYPSYEEYLKVSGYPVSDGDKLERLYAFKTGYLRAKENFPNWLKTVKHEDYYLFIISKNQLETWNKHLDIFNIKEFVIYRKEGIPNRQYKDEKRLNVFILKFDKQFLDPLQGVK